jgi:predicted dehydrogenase/threonine dehydrogenase-like Zn-dependent dehydrogenase
MKQLLVRGGAVAVEVVPAPTATPGSIVVRVAYSCVSVGTETTSVRMSGMPLYRRALKQPEHVKRVLRVARDQGLIRTVQRVRGQLAAGLPTGYSAAGVVTELGDNVVGFSVGDRVACAGAGAANHAEFICVPVNLAVKIPDSVSLEHASTATLGAIALQGVRRAAPTLGETIGVMGLGIIGQLTVQLLRASGCRVVGVDLDSRRVATALRSGITHGIDAASESFVERVTKLTDGFGADAVIVTASTGTSDVIHEAMQACRKKGRVVVVGDVGLNLRRSDMYEKELDFLISTSYGPGRYDTRYEEDGLDYPLPYVRWTENRNLEEYLRLVADGAVSLDALDSRSYPIEDAPAAYALLSEPGPKPLLVTLRYANTDAMPSRTVHLRAAHPAATQRLQVALIGAGSFAEAMHLPNLAKLRASFQLHSVLSRTGSEAKSAAARHGAAIATTDLDAVLGDPEIDVVLITTRHDSHAELLLASLQAGKHVFVEKPLAMDAEELDRIERFFAEASAASRVTPVLMTGFNRRFSPALGRIREVLSGRTTPLLVDYRMNAGYVPLGSWLHGPEGGGRNIGEACHVYDLFDSLTGAEFIDVSARPIQELSKQWVKNDNFVATISYRDGSVCVLVYTALGNTAHPKERMEIFADGKVVTLDDYRSVAVAGGRYSTWRSVAQEKGHLQELSAFADCLIKGGPWPITLEEQLRAMRIAFAVEQRLNGTDVPR